MASPTMSRTARAIASLVELTDRGLVAREDDGSSGSAQKSEGIGIVSFLTAVGIAVAIFAAQFLLFLLLRNKLARILYVTATSHSLLLCCIS